MIVAIITARGGSRRLPNKNIKMLCGKPLLVWSILQAKQAESIDKVYLTTDSENYAAIGYSVGAEVILRPVFPDDTTAGFVFDHAVEVIEKKHEITAVVAMLPTQVLRPPGQIDEIIKTWYDMGVDKVVPIVPERETVVMEIEDRRATLVAFNKTWRYGTQGCGPGIVSIEKYKEPAHASDKDSEIDLAIEANPSKFYHDVPFYPQERWQQFDIDDEKDFEFSECLFQHYVLDQYGEDCFD